MSCQPNPQSTNPSIRPSFPVSQSPGRGEISTGRLQPCVLSYIHNRPDRYRYQPLGRPLCVFVLCKPSSRGRRAGWTCGPCTGTVMYSTVKYFTDFLVQGRAIQRRRNARADAKRMMGMGWGWMGTCQRLSPRQTKRPPAILPNQYTEPCHYNRYGGCGRTAGHYYHIRDC
jgi:hypothetical protein